MPSSDPFPDLNSNLNPDYEKCLKFRVKEESSPSTTTDERYTESNIIYLDKAVSGEYVLGKPPNKPGGAGKLSKVLMLCWMMPECVDCIKLGGDNPEDFMLNFFGISFKKWISIVVMMLLISLIVWFICLDVNEDFEDLPIEIREHFDIEADRLMGQFENLFEINISMEYEELLVALQNMFMNESLMLDDDESSFALCLQKNPKRKIAWFRSGVENVIDKGSSRYKCGKDNAGILYFEKLYQMDQSKAEPSPRYLKLCQINQLKSRRRYLGTEKWRARRQQNNIPAETHEEIEGDKKSELGIKTSDRGIFLFSTARNFFPDSISELNISDTKQNV